MRSRISRCVSATTTALLLIASVPEVLAQSPKGAASGPKEAAQRVRHQFGAWKIVLGADGRFVAQTSATPGELGQIAGLHVECVAGGRLEYVPVALKLGLILSVWLNDGGNTQEMPLVKGRAAGRSAWTLSKLFLEYDASYRRSGTPAWKMEMRIDNDDGPMTDMPMGGFSEMRRFMLDNCKG